MNGNYTCLSNLPKNKPHATLTLTSYMSRTAVWQNVCAQGPPVALCKATASHRH
jgi:hypothetical protein